jgi:hypothetical protein
LLVTANGISAYFPLRFGGSCDRRSFQRHGLAPGFGLEDPEVKLVEMDDDGVIINIAPAPAWNCISMLRYQNVSVAIFINNLCKEE